MLKLEQFTVCYCDKYTNKIYMNFYIRSDLSQDHYNVLQSELFRHISAFSGGPKIVLTRLCVAVSEVAIYVELQQKINVTSIRI